MGAEVTLFDATGLLLILMIFHYKSMVSSHYNHCHFHINILEILVNLEILVFWRFCIIWWFGEYGDSDIMILVNMVVVVSVVILFDMLILVKLVSR